MVTTLDNTNALDTFSIFCRVDKDKDQIRTKWMKPQQGWVKCNTDACAMGAPGWLKGGGLFRDSDGNFMGAFTANLGIGFAFEGELAAALLAIEIAHDRNWNKLWLESDSMYVVQIFNTQDPQVPWKCLEKWRWVKRYLNSIHWVITHVYREANASADCVSRFIGDDVFYWWDSCPPWLYDFLYKDMHNEFVRS